MIGSITVIYTISYKSNIIMWANAYDATPLDRKYELFKKI